MQRNMMCNTGDYSCSPPLEPTFQRVGIDLLAECDEWKLVLHTAFESSHVPRRARPSGKVCRRVHKLLLKTKPENPFHIIDTRDSSCWRKSRTRN